MDHDYCKLSDLPAALGENSVLHKWKNFVILRSDRKTRQKFNIENFQNKAIKPFFLWSLSVHAITAVTDKVFVYVQAWLLQRHLKKKVGAGFSQNARSNNHKRKAKSDQTCQTECVFGFHAADEIWKGGAPPWPLSQKRKAPLLMMSAATD